jgi:hypothetical protein
MDFDLSNIVPKSINKLNEHIITYFNLYLKPIQSYKKVFSKRKSSLNFLTLHAIYYTILLILVLSDIRMALLFLILEILSTISPFLTYIIPFLIFTKVFNKNKTWVNLFRLLLVIKFQHIPILIFFVILAKKIDEGVFFIFVDNWIILIVVSFITCVPLIIGNIQVWQRIVWAMANYVAFFLVNAIMVSAIDHIDLSGSISYKLGAFSPSSEYYTQIDLDSSSISSFKDDSYMIIIDRTTARLRNTQFITDELFNILLIASYNQNLHKLNTLDSLLAVQDPKRKREYHMRKQMEEIIPVNLRSLDSIRHSFNYRFSHDTTLFRFQKDSLRFKINKEYAAIKYNYLSTKNSLYIDIRKTHKIAKENKINYRIDLDSNKVGVVFKLDSIQSYKQKKIILDKNLEIDKLLNKSAFLEDIFFYPANLASNIWNYLFSGEK